MYLGPVLLHHLHADQPTAEFAERLAAIMAHEEGHVVQDIAHQQQPTNMLPDAGLRFIEQQADCLSGVWAHGIGLDEPPFLQAARAWLTDVDDAEHRLDHGTVAQRFAAVHRGLTGLSACKLRGH
jgi:predicted metalloprotease